MTTRLNRRLCLKCNTVWASPGICKCSQVNEVHGYNWWCARCNAYHGSGLPDCERHLSVGIKKAVDIKPLLAGSGNDSLLAREIWNNAVEAAALIADDNDKFTSIEIRKLKR